MDGASEWGGRRSAWKGSAVRISEAREALEIGLGLGLPGPVYYFDGLLLYHFLRTEPALVDRFIGETLGPLIAYDDRRRGELIKTMEAYFECDASVKLAGQRLFAHPHTVTYRLEADRALDQLVIARPRGQAASAACVARPPAGPGQDGSNRVTTPADKTRQ